MVYAADGRVVAVNTAACELLGVEASRLVGSSAREAGWKFKGRHGGHPVLGALKTGRPVRAAIARVERPDRTQVWLQVDAMPGPDGGARQQVLMTLTDVTALVSGSTGRASQGDHIVQAIDAILDQSRLEPRAILATVTRELASLRPAIWVASLMGKDPSNVLVVAADDSEEFDAGAASNYVEKLQQSGIRSTPLSNRVIESNQPLVIPSITMRELMAFVNDEIRDYVRVTPLLPEDVVVGVVATPMHARGAVIGALSVFQPPGSEPLDAEDARWIQAVADRTAEAVENAQLYEDAIKRLERLTALQGVSLAVSASPDLTLTLKVILDHVAAQLKVDAADILLLDESDNSLTLAGSTGFLATAVPDFRLPADEGMPGRALSSRRIETVTALSAFSQFRRRSMFAREGFKAYGAVPLVSRGRLLGALEVFHRSALNPDQEWLSFLDALGSVAAVAIDNASMQERLRMTRLGPHHPGRPAPDMTRVEREVMKLAAEGMTNVEIAARVHLSPNTIKFHIRQILKKAGAANRTDLAHQAAREGWL